VTGPSRAAGEEARKKAIDLVRRKSGGAQAPARTNGAARRSQPGFEALDDRKQVNVMRVVSEAMGIANPFFRSHDGPAAVETHIDGRAAVNFATYDYLGLGQDARVRKAAHDAIDRYGISAGASRLVAGERPIHGALEAALARHYRTDDAITFVSGHATNVSAIGALMSAKDLVLTDSLIHNSISVGAQLSGASRRSFAHNDLDALERMLAENARRYRHILVAVEGLYSMDGDLPYLPRLLDLRARFGFWLLVDEAHALGTIGATGGGVAEHFGIDGAEVDIWMGTLSKTLGATGGYIAGSSALIDILKSSAPGFVFSVGLPPVLAATALAALAIMGAEPVRSQRLQANGARFLERARAVGLDTGESIGSSVLPVMVGDSLKAAKLSELLLARGFNVLPILFPAVPMNAARLRFFITSEHTADQIDTAIAATRDELDRLDREGFGMKLTPELMALIKDAT
jgi:8-amino-7-oxononanoate synthase